MLENNKDAVLRELDRKVEKALTMIGEQAVGYAQEIVHENEGKNAQKYVGEASERSGELANLMEFEVDMSDDSVIIGTNVEYAPYVEFMDSRHHNVGKAHFLRDGAVNHVNEIKAVAETALSSI